MLSGWVGKVEDRISYESEKIGKYNHVPAFVVGSLFEAILLLEN